MKNLKLSPGIQLSFSRQTNFVNLGINGNLLYLNFVYKNEKLNDMRYTSFLIIIFIALLSGSCGMSQLHK